MIFTRKPRRQLGDAHTAEFQLNPVLIFALIFSTIFILHAPLLRLPYFWDEAGYFIPAARDLLLTGDPIPRTTLVTSHPPLVSYWLALWWKLSGFTAAVTHTAMLFFASFALLGVFQLARHVSNLQVAIASTICTALYPVFFVQSVLAHADMAAAAFTIWGLLLYLRNRGIASGVSFALAALAKETAVITPVALFATDLFLRTAPFRWLVFLAWAIYARASGDEKATGLGFIRQPSVTRQQVVAVVFPLVALSAWFAYQYARTGSFFGAPEYFRYNLESTFHPSRIVLALVRRTWQAAGHMNLFLLTGATAVAMLYAPVKNRLGERARITIPTQLLFAAIIFVHVVIFSLIGGALLARYMLPAIPLVIIICVSTIWRRFAWWRGLLLIVCLGFILGLAINPPYRFAMEDNLAYTDYVHLHRRAAEYLEQRRPKARVLTSWPATDELTKPFLGYVRSEVPVVAVPNLSAETLISAAQTSVFDVAFLFSTKFEPRFPLIGEIEWWNRLQTRFFDYHRVVVPRAAASMLGGRLIYEEHRGNQWVAVLEIERVQNAGESLPQINADPREPVLRVSAPPL
jgi:hypothetical protein